MRSFFLSIINLLAFFLGTFATNQSNGHAQDFPTAGPVKKVHDGFQFTEGPAYDGKKYLYFTDIPNNRILRTDLIGGLEVFLEPSGKCNGLMLDGKGTLIACRMDGELIAVDTSSKKVTTLSGEFQGKRFNACNDLVIDKQGGIYFTDPRYAAPEPWPQKVESFYYRSPSGNVSRLGEQLTAPNGIILSPDEKTLYVLPSMQKELMAYEVLEPGKIGSGKVLYEIKQPAGKTNSGGDGLSVDVDGNLYLTTDLGIQVVSPQGKLLGIIQLPEQPANCAFGGPGNKTLFATCRTGLYSVELAKPGHVFPGVVKLQP
ncbi:SMP-30/gluconolactonase/LRE family protein [Pirellulaceae bacterium SH467]